MPHDIFMRTREVQWFHPWSKRIREWLWISDNGRRKIEMETRTKKNNLTNDPFFRLKYAMFYIDHSEKLSYSFICKPFIRILIFFESAIHMVILCYIRTILIASINTSKKNLVTVVLVYCCRIWSLYYKVWLFFVPN